jgi:hypothetical protein
MPRIKTLLIRGIRVIRGSILLLNDGHFGCGPAALGLSVFICGNQSLAFVE